MLQVAKASDDASKHLQNHLTVRLSAHNQLFLEMPAFHDVAQPPDEDPETDFEGDLADNEEVRNIVQAQKDFASDSVCAHWFCDCEVFSVCRECAQPPCALATCRSCQAMKP